jgi:hypothetical protein
MDAGKFYTGGPTMAQFLFQKLSYLLLKFAFPVHNVLGPGLMESAYEGAFVVELSLAGVPFQRGVNQWLLSSPAYNPTRPFSILSLLPESAPPTFRA